MNHELRSKLIHWGIILLIAFIAVIVISVIYNHAYVSKWAEYSMRAVIEGIGMILGIALMCGIFFGR